VVRGTVFATIGFATACRRPLCVIQEGLLGGVGGGGGGGWYKRVVGIWTLSFVPKPRIAGHAVGSHTFLPP